MADTKALTALYVPSALESGWEKNWGWEEVLRRKGERRYLSLYTQVHSVMYDSGSVPDECMFSPRGTSQKTEVGRRGETVRGRRWAGEDERQRASKWGGTSYLSVYPPGSER